LQCARDVALRARRQELFEISPVASKPGEDDIAGLVAGIDNVRRARAAGRRRAMAVDRDMQRRDRSGDGIANRRAGAAVDDGRRQMKEQIDDARSSR
jgi:hypothetical protein